MPRTECRTARMAQSVREDQQHRGARGCHINGAVLRTAADSCRRAAAAVRFAASGPETPGRREATGRRPEEATTTIE